jgi:hypothetical protein
MNSRAHTKFYIRGMGKEAMNLTTHLYVMPRLRMVEQYFISPIRLLGVVLSYRSPELIISIPLLASIYS